MYLDSCVRPERKQIRTDLRTACDAQEENETHAYRIQPEISHHHRRRRWYQTGTML